MGKRRPQLHDSGTSTPHAVPKLLRSKIQSNIAHQNNRSIVIQQELLTDVKSYQLALRHILRQDPDVIVIGEMRDLETI